MRGPPYSKIIGCVSARCPNNRRRYIFHIGRLQSHQAAAEHRIDWEPVEKLEDGSEKRIVRSEHYRWPDDKCVGERGPDRLFAFTALLDVPRS
jgi:hypothetical protein